jgi:hypothetical protein
MLSPEIDALEIVVVVDDGEVTLSGEVDDRHAKRLAEDIAEQVPGVRDVRNELKARHGFLDRLLGRDSDEERSRSDRDVTPGAQRERASATSGTSTGTSTGTSASGATSGSSTGTGATGSSGSSGSGSSGSSSSSTRGRNASTSTSSDRS